MRSHYYINPKRVFGVWMLIWALFSVPQLNAQNIGIKGKVVDEESGLGLPGVTVLFDGGGTVTDIDGNFFVAEINVSSITLSFIGFMTQTIEVNDGDILMIEMSPDILSLEEIVVTGYGSKKKSLLTGSISKVEGLALENVKTVRIEQALQGSAPGVLVVPNSGQPGDGFTINIRGFGTPGSHEPLYIVDGLPLSGQALDLFNPSDIESMEVLKDAAASAIYGARGANGVVIITTKSGKKGSTKITYDGFYGVQNPWHRQEVLNSDQYMRIMNEASINDGSGFYFGVDNMDTMRHDTDWQEEMYFRNAPKQSHIVSISGGDETGTYVSSVSYFNQEGVIAEGKSQFERVNFRLGGNKKVGHLSVGGNINLAQISSKGISTNDAYGAGINQAINLPPVIPVTHDNGSWGLPEHYGKSMQEIVNPIALLENINSQSLTKKMIAGLHGEYEFISGLKFRTAYSTEVANVNSRSFNPEYYINATNRNLLSSVSQSLTDYSRWNWDNTLTYEKSIGNHSMTVLVGTTRFEETSQGVSGFADSLLFQSFDKAFLDNSLRQNGESFRPGGGIYEHTIQSYFSRIYYDYKEKYLFEGVVRRDGSSNFGASNRYGTFPAVSVGWVLTNEDFIPKLPMLDFAKLRASWGQNGNEAIGSFAFTSLVSRGHQYNFGTNEQLYDGIQPAFIANTNVRWESSEQLDIGLDLRFFEGKLQFTVDYYEKRNRDWLLNGASQYPRLLGNLVADINAGSIKNSGFEFEINYAKQMSNGLMLRADWTASTNKNEILELIEGTEHLIGTGGGHGQGAIQRGSVGMPLGYFWLYETAGIFNSRAAIANAPHQQAAALGDLIFVDQNDDGVLNEEDKKMIGNPYPKFMMGLNTSLEYKGIDLSMFWYSALGHDIYNATRRMDLGVSNYGVEVLDRWTESNPDTDIPRVTITDPNRSWRRESDFYLESADYLRLKNVTVGYTIPKGTLSRINLGSIRVYVTSENLLTITNYTGMEVEVGGGPLNMGVDRGLYPQAKTFVTGVNLTF